MQNISIVPAKQHGCRAKPLLVFSFLFLVSYCVVMSSLEALELKELQIFIVCSFCYLTRARGCHWQMLSAKLSLLVAQVLSVLLTTA